MSLFIMGLPHSALLYVTNSKSPQQGFSESVKILGAQKKKAHKIVSSKTLVREKTGVSEGENIYFFYISLWFDHLNFKHAVQRLF